MMLVYHVIRHFFLVEYTSVLDKPTNVDMP